MQRVNIDGVVYYQFDQLCDQPHLRHAVFTRLGGASQGPFASLNTSLGVGDDPRAVHSNRQWIADWLPGAELIFAHQVHGDRIAVVPGSEKIPRADALVTAEPQCALVIQVADCQSVLLYDPCRQVLANVHAGWRGSVANIVGRTVALMGARMGSRAANLIAGVSPSLGPCCAEFIHFRQEIPSVYWEYKNGRDHFDFWQITRRQLLQAGLLPHHIEIAGLCTKCHTDLFYSYRGAPVTGRFATTICRL